MANKKIDEIEGIGPAFAAQLQRIDIKTTDELLEQGRTSNGRRDIAERTEIAEKKILQWVNMADLFRIKGVGAEYAELMEAAGVDTVKELKHRNAENLTKKMTEVNAEKKLTRQVPSTKMVVQWIDEAKIMPAGVEY